MSNDKEIVVEDVDGITDDEWAAAMSESAVVDPNDYKKQEFLSDKEVKLLLESVDNETDYEEHEYEYNAIRLLEELRNLNKLINDDNRATIKLMVIMSIINFLGFVSIIFFNSQVIK